MTLSVFHVLDAATVPQKFSNAALRESLPVISSSLVGLRLRAGGGLGPSRVIEGR